MNPKVIKFLARHFFFEIIAVAGIISFHQVNKSDEPLNSPAYPENQHDLIEKTPSPIQLELQYQSMSLNEKRELPRANY